jgi:hypothetical protein
MKGLSWPPLRGDHENEDFNEGLPTPTTLQPDAENGSKPAAEAVSGLGGLIVKATHVGGKIKQQDAVWHAEIPGAKMIAVADGVSSSPHSADAAWEAVRVAINVMSIENEITANSLRIAFNRAHEAIRMASGGRRRSQMPHSTLIVAVELKDRLLLAYAGDGAIVLCSGDLHWMTNVLHPHVGEAEMLVNYLGRADGSPEPAVLELPKQWPSGIAVMIGTDGALELGKTMTTSGEILGELAAGVRHWPRAEAQERASGLLREWVQERIDSDDNRTLGLIVSREALAHWQGVPV